MTSVLRIVWGWIQANSSGISVLLSIVGFAVVLLQIKKTRNAAESAKRATEDALRAISSRDTTSDLATIRERINKLQIALRGERYEIANHEAQSLREGFYQLRNREGFDTDDIHIEIQGIVTFLKKLQDQMERKLADSSYKVPVRNVNARLSDYATTIAEWIEKRRFILGG